MRAHQLICLVNLIPALALGASGCRSSAVVKPGVGNRVDAASTAFTLVSPAFRHGDEFPAAYTCDGAGVSPPLQWSGAPEGTAEYALLMTTVARDGLKWNWAIYGIPREVTSLSEGSVGVGIPAMTSHGPATVYAPVCPRGPGPKTYTFTLHALSRRPVFDMPANEIDARALAEGIGKLTLGVSQLSVVFNRAGSQP